MSTFKKYIMYKIFSVILIAQMDRMKPPIYRSIHIISHTDYFFTKNCIFATLCCARIKFWLLHWLIDECFQII